MEHQISFKFSLSLKFSSSKENEFDNKSILDPVCD